MIAFLPSISLGLGKDLQAARSPQAFAVANLLVVAITVLAWHLGLKHLFAGVASAIVCIAFWAIYLRRRLGGHTGDLLGAGNQFVEIAVMIALCFGGNGGTGRNL